MQIFQSFWTGLAIGLFLGNCLGIALACWLAAAADCDREMRRYHDESI